MADPQRPHEEPSMPGKNPGDAPKPGEQQPGRTRPEDQGGQPGNKPGERKQQGDNDNERHPAPGSQP